MLIISYIFYDTPDFSFVWLGVSYIYQLVFYSTVLGPVVMTAVSPGE